MKLILLFIKSLKVIFVSILLSIIYLLKNKSKAYTMKKLKHSKYKNTGILFEMLVRKLTSETLSSNKSTTVDIIKNYFGRNTELSKELQLYNTLFHVIINLDMLICNFNTSGLNCSSKSVILKIEIGRKYLASL